MSPFAIFLKRLRMNRGYKQNALAHHLGYESSYLSALERSEKGPPRQDFIKKLIKGLELDEGEQAELMQALKASRRQISLPARASEGEYALFRKLESQLGSLQPLQIQLMELALEIPEGSLVAGQTNASCAPVHISSRKEGHRI